MTSLLRFLPPELVVFADAPLLKGLSKEQKLLCMLAVFVLDFADIEHAMLRQSGQISAHFGGSCQSCVLRSSSK